MPNSNGTDPSNQIRGHLAAAIARLESFSRRTGPLDRDGVIGAIAVAEVELARALTCLNRCTVASVRVTP
jgi:hypothetical protein